MAEKYSFFNAVLSGEEYDRTYKAEDLAEYFSSFIANGVFPNPSTNLQVMSTGNMDISIGTGKAWINGYYYSNTENMTKTLNVADGTLDRIDLVVLRLDLTKRLMQIDIKVGTTASNPTTPELTRTDSIYELGLASIYIASGVTSIRQANITDLRYNQDYCGYVTNTVTTIDTETLLNQVTDWADAKKTEYENEFTTWFEALKDTLSGDVEGNLTNLININASNIATIQQSINDLNTIRNNITALQNAIVISNNKSKTSITDFTNNTYLKKYSEEHNWYCIKNGWCMVHLDISVNTDNLNAYRICRNLPTSTDTEVWGQLHGQGGTMKNKSAAIYLKGSSIMLDYSGGKGRYIGSLVYPVENYKVIS